MKTLTLSALLLSLIGCNSTPISDQQYRVKSIDKCVISANYMSINHNMRGSGIKKCHYTLANGDKTVSIAEPKGNIFYKTTSGYVAAK